MRLPLLAALVLGLVAPAAAVADPIAGPQRVVEQAAGDTAATCRRDTPASDEQCGAVPLSPAVSEAAVAAYEKSDLHRALALQYELGNDLPFRNASWIGTHNSFNTTTREPTASGLDPNQQLSMTDQLRIDVRSLEVDAHWFPSAEAGGAYAPVLCHARGEDQKHAGCSTEPLLADGIADLAPWLRAHPRQVLLLYVEDHLETDAGYAAGAEVLQKAFGDLLYAPGGTGCTPLPLDDTRNDVLAAGKQVLVISGCHSGAGWNGTVFSGAARAKDETGPAGYGEDGTCDPKRLPGTYDSHLLRVFEDSTALSATVNQGSDRISAAKAATLARCAVDITGFDQLLPGDGRLAGSLWSWAPGEPAASGDCAVQRDGRFSASPCSGRHAVACRAADGTWSVGPLAPHARLVCPTGVPATPRYGYEAAQLAAAAGPQAVWLPYERTGTTWTATDTR
ncbi:MAG: hypothetical protein LC789_12250 [Actinobacteria bacterium]|nr:hypothetical protein [Actinomycetota bacterium]MCA1721284.1 hypothetical protein [Actinomycetota bacterium]